jgi:glycosyltransferase involved in cell wall biosynthesis
MSLRLAILTSHPIQYYAPWFRSMALDPDLDITVFYLWDFGIRPTHDPGFNQTFAWDIPLLDGYKHVFVPNTSPDPGTHHWGGLRNPGLKQAILDWNPDAVLTIGYAHESVFKWILQNRLARIPLLLKGDSHRLVPDASIKSQIKNILVSLFFKTFDAFLYCGQANREYFRHRGIKDNRLFFSPHAIDLDRFQTTSELRAEADSLRSNLGLTPEHKVVLFAGKFEVKKRPQDLLEAYLKCRDQNSRLLFAGSGPLEKELRSKAKGFPDILFLPIQNQSRMPALYLAADLFVLPSCGPNETWGLAVQESLACGTPVVVSSHVGCHPDLVLGRNNGLVFEAGSVDSLSNALQKALCPGQLEKWILNCRKTLDHFTYAEATLGLKGALAFLVR